MLAAAAWYAAASIPLQLLLDYVSRGLKWHACSSLQLTLAAAACIAAGHFLMCCCSWLAGTSLQAAAAAAAASHRCKSSEWTQEHKRTGLTSTDDRFSAVPLPTACKQRR
jgi:hypothetical protein